MCVCVYVCVCVYANERERERERKIPIAKTQNACAHIYIASAHFTSTIHSESTHTKKLHKKKSCPTCRYALPSEKPAFDLAQVTFFKSPIYFSFSHAFSFLPHTSLSPFLPRTRTHKDTRTHTHLHTHSLSHSLSLTHTPERHTICAPFAHSAYGTPRGARDTCTHVSTKACDSHALIKKGKTKKNETKTQERVASRSVATTQLYS